MPSDRRTRFREVFQRLDPSESPRAAIQNGFYVPPPNPIADRIAHNLDLNPRNTHLLCGGIGSGKTTTLLTVKRLAEETGEFSAVVIDVPKLHDVSVARPGVLMAIGASSARARLLKEQEEGALPTEMKTVLKRISDLAQGYYDYPDEGDDHYPDDNYQVWIKGVLKTPGHSPVVSELRELATTVVGALKLKPIVLFDGLDRVEDAASFATMVVEDVPSLSAAGFGCVVVGPQHLRFRPQRAVQDLFTASHLQGALPVSTDDGGTFLRSVLRARVDAEVMPDDACDRVAFYSGGLLRDLISLGRAASEEAYGSGADAVHVEHVAAAADRFGRGLLTGITEPMAKRLKDFVDVPVFGKNREPTAKELRFTLATELDVALLMARLIIEVPGVPLRYIPHPTTVHLIAGLP